MKDFVFTQTSKHWCLRDFMPTESMKEKEIALDKLCKLITCWFSDHGHNTVVSWRQEEDRSINSDGSQIVFQFTTTHKYAE